ncbi:MAG: hypothetical protein M1274_02720 [Actinobacteria bacterium]|nr:hypothetical protein [Actinomycetota bacterium]
MAICNGLRAKRHKDTHGLVTTFAVGVILLVGLVVHFSPSVGRPVTWWQDHVAPVDLVTTQRTSDGKADVATYRLAAGAWGSDEYYVVTHRRLIGLVEQRRLIAVIPSNMPDAQWADSRTVEVNGILMDAWKGSLVESR